MALIPTLVTLNGTLFSLNRNGVHSIGSENAVLTFADEDILPLHAAFIVAGSRVMLRIEVGAYVLVNGLQVNGMLTLHEHDRITLGSLDLTLEFKDVTEIPSPGLFFSHPNPFVPDSQTDEKVPHPILDEQNDGNLEEDIPLLQPISLDSSANLLEDEVSFTAYFPREVHSDLRAGFFVYAHTADAVTMITRDIRRFLNELQGEIPRPRTANKTIQIAPGTPITVSIECDEIEFDPPSLTRKWDDEWVRFDFYFKIPSAKKIDNIVADIIFRIAGVEIAAIRNCLVEILSPMVKNQDDSDNPLAYAKMTYEETRLYQRIFVSYSRKDREVVDAYHLAQRALGNEVFIDTEAIRIGDDWQRALAKAIDQADILQLFWSENSASSPNVRDEWDYALKYRCSQDGCRGFIRPVYWSTSLPPTPTELSHLHFRKVPLGESSK